MGRVGRSHHRRDGPRVAEHHLLQRRGVQSRSGQAQCGEADDDDLVARDAALADDPMQQARARLAVCLGAFALAAGALTGAVQVAPQGQGQTPSPFPLSNPIRERGSSVTGAYEGWLRAKDGGSYFLVGYSNRNTKQELDIPIGPNNRIEPGGPDQGQPTHFLRSRQWGVCSIKIPNDLG